jgi:hypothetical protein
MKCIICLIFTIIFLSGCLIDKSNFYAKPNKLNNRQPNAQLNGVYYFTYDNQSEIGTFILYPNGVAIWYPTVYQFKPDLLNNLDSLKKQIQWTINYDNNFSKKKQAGGYIVNERKIVIQIFRRLSGGLMALCEYRGTLIDSDAIMITECNYKEHPDACVAGFLMKGIDIQKPDSSNSFVNKHWYWEY